MEDLDTGAIAEELNRDEEIFGGGSVEDNFSQDISDVGEHADESVEDTEKGDKKFNKIMEQLTKLQGKIQADQENGKWNPFKALYVNSKLGILQARLQRRFNKLHMQDVKNDFQKMRDTIEKESGGDFDNEMELLRKLIDQQYAIIEEEEAKRAVSAKVMEERANTYREMNSKMPKGRKPIGDNNLDNGKLTESEEKIAEARRQIEQAKETQKTKIEEWNKLMQRIDNNIEKDLLKEKNALIKPETGILKNVKQFFKDIRHSAKNSLIGSMFTKVKDAIKTAVKQHKNDKQTYKTQKATELDTHVKDVVERVSVDSMEAQIAANKKAAQEFAIRGADGQEVSPDGEGR